MMKSWKQNEYLSNEAKGGSYKSLFFIAATPEEPRLVIYRTGTKMDSSVVEMVNLS